MRFRRLTDREAARVGVAVAAALQVAAALGLSVVSDIEAEEATAVVVVVLPFVLGAGEWIRRRVYSKRTARLLTGKLDP
jgi:hypothetical protein